MMICGNVIKMMPVLDFRQKYEVKFSCGSLVLCFSAGTFIEIKSMNYT